MLRQVDGGGGALPQTPLYDIAVKGLAWMKHVRNVRAHFRPPISNITSDFTRVTPSVAHSCVFGVIIPKKILSSNNTQIDAFRAWKRGRHANELVLFGIIAS